MWKIFSFFCGGVLVAVGIYALSVRPTAGPAQADGTKPLVVAMADHLFKESGLPVLVRRNDNLTDCNESGADGNLLLLNQKDQDAVTEFVYTSRLVCVNTYLSRQQAPDGQKPVELNSGHYEATFGELRPKTYYLDRSLGFHFPMNANGSIPESAIGEFFQQIPRYFNAKSKSGLSHMVTGLESPETAAETFVKKVVAAQPKANPGLGFHPGWLAILILGTASLATPGVLVAWKRLRPAAGGSSPGEMPATAPAQASIPLAEPAQPSLAELQEEQEREEKVIRMIALLKESITEEAPFIANLIFAKAEDVAKKAFNRGADPHDATRVYLAGQLADLLDRRHRSLPERPQEKV